jgi:hypothetical protein
MPRHELYFDVDLRDVEVKSKDVVFMVYQDGEKFGELRLSRGAIVWRGRLDKLGRKLGWVKFDRIMQEQSRLAERRMPGTRTAIRKSKRSE